MKHISKQDLNAMDRIYRLNLINSCTGYKSANLIGTVSTENIYNVAVFSSITHLGSDPALLTFIVRPTTVPRDTYKNIIDNKEFTVNHINVEDIKEAHHTSARYSSIISEFDVTNLEKEFKDDYKAPFVKSSRIKLGCKYLNQYEIKENNTLLMIAEINDIYFNEDIIQNDGWLNLDIAKTVTVNGLDGYALPSLVQRFEYAKPKNE
ncbi:flavin reductase family protein [Flavobacteriaceae bacterium]|jgi:flavin reductase (DIM6/NTAB) family NADH-FMN oxidoreductase RutF|nr:flavin reductase family protein [Flavobacteriaceae bacterium]MDA9240887.1 flavin reductase family protein [Flavobacteriaceae bacterium]MDA9318974.1 flavin reductase family protein [Flavobacteriaceae bacterium]MDB4092767.1 flavin reductase family protein [Flavobacteriaceae bacterium]MDC0007975.1 flavin reductase family protein [Flavobacteriaceae bacterium]|tara:strand:+ start:305 stop:925 length:621 start_codon:yes stop_codon:yes gene_type:complete